LPADSYGMTNAPEPSTERRMQVRFAGRCVKCGAELAKQSWVLYDQAAKAVRCIECLSESREQHVVNQGIAGASASRAHERRKARREARVKGRVGNFLGTWRLDKKL
jgi:hypothetical protein